MKKLSINNKTLLAAVLGVLIIIAAAVGFIMYSGSKPAKVIKAAQPAAPKPQPIAVTPAPPPPAAVKGVQTAVTAETKKPEVAPVATPPGTARTTVAPPAYEYSSRGRRDPFASLLVQVETEKRKGAPPLESYDVTSFKLTAILWNKSGFYALFLSPDGKNFTLREGTIIGLHSGKVYKIAPDSVIIREFLKDYRGIVRPQDSVFKLRRGEEG
ncbi:MAG: pilus assembly protein PilP [Nitrospirae bacterium]|nr:pilus assembly protein PilP [Nitrospirota bacterium]